METYIPIFGAECNKCGYEPVVGVRQESGAVRSSGLCGPHFFNDRYMTDWSYWNDIRDETE